MNKVVLIFIRLTVLFAIAFATASESTAALKMQNSVIFSPANSNNKGLPKDDYWQQQLDYKIKVELDTQTKQLQGNAQLVYHNILLEN